MRNLTIKRNKAYAGCAVKSKVYIEDPAGTDMVIDGVSCRKLGDLKNGEEKTFQIGEEAARIFVIVGKASASYCKDEYPLPAGTEDVRLTGKHYYNLNYGNPFVFDGTEDREFLKKPKKGGVAGIVVLIVTVIVAVIVGRLVASGTTKAVMESAKTFSNSDFSITLPRKFSEESLEGYDYCFDSGDAAVLALKEAFSEAPGSEELSVEEYCGLLMKSAGLNTKNLQSDEGLVWFTYDASDSEGTTYTYFTTAYKASDAFWMVQFICEKDEFENLCGDFVTWADSIEFQ